MKFIDLGSGPLINFLTVELAVLDCCLAVRFDHEKILHTYVCSLKSLMVINLNVITSKK